MIGRDKSFSPKQKLAETSDADENADPGADTPVATSVPPADAEPVTESAPPAADVLVRLLAGASAGDRAQFDEALQSKLDNLDRADGEEAVVSISLRKDRRGARTLHVGGSVSGKGSGLAVIQIGE